MKSLITIFLSFVFLVEASSQYYNITTFEEPYVPIQDYQSMVIRTEGDPYWEKDFDLPFSFPYFDQSFDKIHASVLGTLSFENEVDFSIRLMAFGYMYDNALDTVDIESDVRYKFTTKNGKKCFIMQWTKVRFFSDPSIEEYDSNVNFQYWFFEDGIIELRFGPSNIDNSPVYIPGDGCYLLPVNDTPKKLGPELALYHPFDENARLYVNDLASYKEIEILYTGGFDSMDWWPESGWVIKFENKYVGTENVENKTAHLSVAPNPNTGTFQLNNKESGQLSIYDMLGNKVWAKDNCLPNQEVVTEGLKPGVYSIVFRTDDYKTTTGKLIIVR